MNILIMPTIEHLRRNLDYEEWDDDVDNELLFRQGYDGYVVEVEDGETFTIPYGAEGQIIDDSPYYINEEVFDGVFEKVELRGTLRAGSFQLNGDIITVSNW